ncbi:dephospho-CoA kinase [Campylobacter sp. MIT 99-7217]|uniref:dephospho-CoA kinase n=1 Tax=Campylobacter sp. MIT 99-7217 TaxID=535091 RepID=UPI0011571CE1|nr:dephospho-CoA kinase [Campylobacter sp. MIT 99-7217]TQR32434.1 dephospho-CoA kinase [Campylobacter sp. MIT 99-7217]
MKNAFFVTASIACGKSSFMKMAQDKGFNTINADSIAHQILEEKAEQIATLFKDHHILKDQKIDRKALALLIFSDEKSKTKLENFMHPLIKDEILKQALVLDAKNKAFFIELPLFFENTNYQGLGKSILIYAPKELSLQRLMQRDKLSKEEALKRLNAQLDIEIKKQKADFIIDNSKDLVHFQEQSEIFFNSLNL